MIDTIVKAASLGASVILTWLIRLVIPSACAGEIKPVFVNAGLIVRSHLSTMLAGFSRESVAPKSTTLAQSLRTEVKALPGVAQKEAAATQKEAAKSAKQIEEESVELEDSKTY